MEFLRRSLYLDITAKGLGLIGVALMIFGQGGWFAVAACRVVRAHKPVVQSGPLWRSNLT